MGKRESDKSKRSRSKNRPIKEANELLKAQLARALADYDNLTKRVEREREEYGKLAKTRLVRKLLPVWDMLNDAQKHLNDQGLAITIQTLESSLEEDGFEKIQTEVGQEFDESLHEVIEVVSEEDKGNGEIVEVLMEGWKIEDFVIRPTKVKVNRIE